MCVLAGCEGRLKGCLKGRLKGQCHLVCRNSDIFIDLCFILGNWPHARISAILHLSERRRLKPARRLKACPTKSIAYMFP